MGHHDLVAVVEAPHNSTAAKALMTLGVKGNVSTATMAALNESEFCALVDDID